MGKAAPTTTTTNSPPPEIMEAYKKVMDRASGVAQTPYTAYDGSLVAGMSGVGQLGTSFVANGYNTAEGAYGAAENYAGLGAHAYTPASVTPTKFSGEALQQYMSPYTQNVIDSTMANINRNNAIQASSLTSNGIKSGNAFGGDRLGVAQAELARGQSMSSDQTIAGLWNQNFAQALGQFNQQQGVDLGAQQFNSSSATSAAQNNAARALQASQLNAGIAGGIASNSMAVGSNLQNYGQQQQATDQAGLSAAYQQWQAAQSFPYAQTSWLSGIQSGLGSLSGGTSTSVGQAPSTGSQILGGLTTAAGLFAMSDERVKDDIEPIGKTFDGQPIYKFRYKGDEQTHVGLMAQDVERKHPDAVREFDGVKGVDYDAATRGAADKGHFAAGGGVMPYGGVSFIPQVDMKHGAGVGIPTAKLQEQKAPDFKAAGSAINSMVDGYLDKFGQPGVGETSAVAGARSGMMGGVSFPMFAAGGAVQRRGVSPRLRGFASGGGAFQDRMDAVMDAVANGDFDPQGINYNEFAGAPADRSIVGREVAAAVPLPRARPVDEPVRIDGVYDPGGAPMTEARAAANFNGTDAGLPPQITGPANDAMPSNVMAFDRPARGVSGAAGQRPGMVDVGTQYERPATNAAPEQSPGVGGGLLEQARGLMPHLSEHAKVALVTAGLAMMASRSPNMGNAIGEGGLAGMNAYAGSQKAEREALESDAKMANDKTRLGYEGQRVAMAADENKRTAAMAKLIPDGKGGMMPNPAYLAQLRAETEISDKSKPVILGYGPTGQAIYGVKQSDGSYTDPISGKPVAEAVGAAESTAGLSGDEFLAAMPDGQRELVKKIANYDIDPKSLSSKGGHRERLLQAAAQYDPTFSQSNYASRYATRKDFTSGKSAQNLSSFNTTLGHLDTLDKAVDKLGNSDYPWWNSISGKAAVAGGNTKYAAAQKDFQTARTAVSDELTRAFRGSGGNVHDIKAWEAAIDQSDSPAALKAAVRQATELLRSRIESVGDAYNRGMGTQREAPELLSPKARKTLDRVLGAEGADGERGGEKPSAMAPVDQKAIAWAKANPNDPRSAAILKANGQ